MKYTQINAAFLNLGYVFGAYSLVTKNSEKQNVTLSWNQGLPS